MAAQNQHAARAPPAVRRPRAWLTISSMVCPGLSRGRSPPTEVGARRRVAQDVHLRSRITQAPAASPAGWCVRPGPASAGVSPRESASRGMRRVPGSQQANSSRFGRVLSATEDGSPARGRA